MKKLTLFGALSVTCLLLAACGDGTPAKQSVEVRPVDPANQIDPPGQEFRSPESDGSGRYKPD